MAQEPYWADPAKKKKNRDSDIRSCNAAFPNVKAAAPWRAVIVYPGLRIDQGHLQ